MQAQVPYDKLVIATGSQGSTFGIPGVLEHTTFLRDIHHAGGAMLLVFLGCGP